MPDFLDRVLQLEPHLRLESLNEEQAFLLGERGQFMLEGRIQVLAVSLLDGLRSVRDILSALDGRASPPEVFYVLRQLHRRGSLVEAAPGVPPERVAFWRALGLEPATAMKRLVEGGVTLHALDGLELEPLRTGLEGAGLRVRDVAPLRVVLVRDYLTPELEALNRQALETHAPWVPVKTTGAVPWVGPVFRPGQGPCWECLAHRLRHNAPVASFLRARTGSRDPLSPPRAELPASLQASAGLAGLRIAQWVAEGGEGPLGHTLVELDLPPFQLRSHVVVRRPQCPACGDPGLLAARAQRPLVLESRPKRFTADGGHRSATPEETWERYQHHISPRTGVLSSLGPVAGRHHPQRPVYGAAFYTPPFSNTPSFDDFHAMSAGKGRTPEQARASALCEGLERVSALFQGDEPRVRARLADLGEAALHPHRLLGFSEAQYREREALAARYRDPRRAIPLPFDEAWDIEWTPVHSLTHGGRRWLPTAYCYARYPLPPERRFCFQDSNGQAAGNNLEEAILQGFLELVERDACALWWYNRLRRPGVDLADFGDAWFTHQERLHARAGWRLWALDLTHDLGIPTFTALGYHARQRRYCVGFGTHLDARLALQRALTEFNQLLDPDGTLPPPWEEDALEDPSFLLPDPARPARTLADFAPVRHEDVREDVRECVARAAGVGLETLVLELTRPDLGLSVAKVVVPGLRHFWPRFAPGRLYDVPVRLGWRAQPLAEAQLNPVPLFL
jgi:ribosomal protein S12 methylthiotransferase accessory factor